MSNEQQNTREALKPCPFCNNDDVGLGYKPHPTKPGEYHSVACLTCGAVGGFKSTQVEAVELWNRRDGAASIDRVEIVANAFVEARRWLRVNDRVDRQHRDAISEAMDAVIAAMEKAK